MYKNKCVCIAIMVEIGIVLSVIVSYLVIESIQDNSIDDQNDILKLVIDNDGGADDAMAIFSSILTAKHYKTIHILGLTTTHGNVNEDQVYYNNQRILKLTETDDIPIYRGVNYSIINTPPVTEYFGHDGMGDTDYKPTDLKPANQERAVDALLRLSKEYPDKLVVVSIGPLTNIALAVSLDPSFLGRLKQLYIGAGHIHDAINNEAEFNAFTDAESYYKVVANASSDKVTVFPFSQVLSFLKVDKKFRLHKGNSDLVSLEVPPTEIDASISPLPVCQERDEEEEDQWNYESIFNQRDESILSWRLDTLGAINSSIIRTQNTFERVSLPKWDYWADLDPAVLAAVLKEDIVKEYKYSKNSIVLCGDKRGFTTNEFVEKEQANVRLVYSASVEGYKQFLLDAFSPQVD